MDSQQVELIGRHRLIAELLRAGVEVAEPIRDRGIDLSAYVDRDQRLSSFVACPIQVKAFPGLAFNLDQKYGSFPNLLIAYLWDVEQSDGKTFALTYPEAVTLADEMGWTATSSWIDKKRYAVTSPSAKLESLLARHLMTPHAWWTKITSAVKAPAV